MARPAPAAGRPAGRPPAARRRGFLDLLLLAGGIALWHPEERWLQLCLWVLPFIIASGVDPCGRGLPFSFFCLGLRVFLLGINTRYFVLGLCSYSEASVKGAGCRVRAFPNEFIVVFFHKVLVYYPTWHTVGLSCRGYRMFLEFSLLF